MVRSPVVVLSVVAMLTPAVSASGATPLCAFDDGTGVVTIHLPVQAVDSAPVVLGRAGDAIVVDGQPCEGATVTTTDSIVVDGEPQPEGVGHRFEIDLSGGSFAPGRADEGDGSSEIEMQVDSGPSAYDLVTIRGGDGPDTMLLDETSVNLDAAPDDAPDVLLLGLHDLVQTEDDLFSADHLSFRLGAGDDLARIGALRDAAAPAGIDVRAAEGDDHVTASHGAIRGEGGDDRLVATRSSAYFSGGSGSDVMVTSRRAGAHFTGGPGRDLLLGGPVGDSLRGGGGPDELRGGGAYDFLGGGPDDDLLFGGANGDLLRAGNGADLLRGGGGSDRMYGGPGRDRCDTQSRDIFVSGCAGPPLERTS
jgi:Ca2+-binding RTX toxin-like protein